MRKYIKIVSQYSMFLSSIKRIIPLIFCIFSVCISSSTYGQSIFKSEFDFNGFYTTVSNVHSYNDGTSIILGNAGYTRSLGNTIIGHSIKIDSVGNLLSEHIYYFDSLDFSIYSSAFDDFGNIYSVGRVKDTVGQFTVMDQFIMKSDTSGAIIWYKAFRFNYYEINDFIRIAIDHNKILIVGTINYSAPYSGDMFVGRLDTAGTIENFRILSTNHVIKATCIIPSTNNTYLISGSILNDTIPIPNMTSCFFLMKTDSVFNPIWQSAYLTNDGGIDIANDLLQINDNRILVAGQATTNNGNSAHAFLLIVDSLGNQLSCTLYCTNYNFREIKNIIRRGDNTFIASGFGIPNFCQIDSNGTILTAKKLGTSNYLYAVTNTNDNGVLVGHSSSTWSAYVLKSDSLLNLSCEEVNYPNCQTASIVFDTFPFIVTDTSYSYTFTEIVYSEPSIPNYNVTCLTYTGIGVQVNSNQIPFRLFPNPSKEFVQIQVNSVQTIPSKIEVFDMLGQLHFISSLNEFAIIIELSNFLSGTYYVRVTNDKFSSIQKFIKL